MFTIEYNPEKRAKQKALDEAREVERQERARKREEWKAALANETLANEKSESEEEKTPSHRLNTCASRFYRPMGMSDWLSLALHGSLFLMTTISTCVKPVTFTDYTQHSNPLQKHDLWTDGKPVFAVTQLFATLLMFVGFLVNALFARRPALLSSVFGTQGVLGNSSGAKWAFYIVSVGYLFWFVTWCHVIGIPGKWTDRFSVAQLQGQPEEIQKSKDTLDFSGWYTIIWLWFVGSGVYGLIGWLALVGFKDVPEEYIPTSASDDGSSSSSSSSSEAEDLEAIGERTALRYNSERKIVAYPPKKSEREIRGDE